MTGKAKSSGRLRRAFFRIAGPTRSRSILARWLRAGRRLDHLDLPIDASTVKRVLFILPPRVNEVLHQLKNVLSLRGLFRNAESMFLCENGSAQLVGMLQSGTVLEYDTEEWQLFSPRFNEIRKQLQSTVDVCFVLERSPDLSMLYLGGAIGAPVRVGYEIAGDFPFINLRVKPVSKRYAADWNSAMALLLGASPGKRLRWSVSRATQEQVGAMVTEAGLHSGVKLVGLDLIRFRQLFGKSWCEDLVGALRPYPEKLFAYSEKETDPEVFDWCHSLGLSLFCSLPVSRVAGLVSRAEAIVSCNSLLFGMSLLLDKPAVGIFSPQELETYCPQTRRHRGIAYDSAGSHTEIIGELVKVAREILP